MCRSNGSSLTFTSVFIKCTPAPLCPNFAILLKVGHDGSGWRGQPAFGNGNSRKGA